ncbi:MAG: DMT family transporter [Gemmobacter sp.]|nr:DMT family transporter [Gemmobacter sp.]
MRPLRGIAYKLASVVMFITMGALLKATSVHVPPGEMVFFRAIFALPVILFWLWMRRELSLGVRTANPWGHFWRGVMGTTSMGLGFAGLGLLPFPEVTAIGYAAPLLTVVFAAMFLSERVGIFRISTVGLGMIGVLIVLSPRLTVGAEVGYRETLGAMLVLMGAVFGALAQVTVRKLVATERTSVIVFWFSITAAVLSLITIPFGWVVPTPAELVLLVSAGLLGGVGQILLTSGYREADASVVAPFEYASMLFALGIGYFVFGEVPTLTMLGGAGIVILAGIVIIWRERRLGLERAKQRKAMTP